jgi:hypothetical protein
MMTLSVGIRPPSAPTAKPSNTIIEVSNELGLYEIRTCGVDGGFHQPASHPCPD